MLKTSLDNKQTLNIYIRIPVYLLHESFGNTKKHFNDILEIWLSFANNYHQTPASGKKLPLWINRIYFQDEKTQSHRPDKQGAICVTVLQTRSCWTATLQLLHSAFAWFIASCWCCVGDSTCRLTTTTPLSNRQKVPLSVGRHTKARIEQRWVEQEQGRTEGRVSEDETKKTPSDCGWLFQSLASSRPSDPTQQPFGRGLSWGFSAVTQASLSLSERWCPSGATTTLSSVWPCYFWGCRPSRVVMKTVRCC